MKDGKVDEKAASGCPLTNKKVEDIDAKAVDDVSQASLPTQASVKADALDEIE